MNIFTILQHQLKLLWQHDWYHLVTLSNEIYCSVSKCQPSHQEALAYSSDTLVVSLSLKNSIWRWCSNITNCHHVTMEQKLVHHTNSPDNVSRQEQFNSDWIVAYRWVRFRLEKWVVHWFSSQNRQYNQVQRELVVITFVGMPSFGPLAPSPTQVFKKYNLYKWLSSNFSWVRTC